MHSRWRDCLNSGGSGSVDVVVAAVGKSSSVGAVLGFMLENPI
jgi:hypothetical protein